MHSFSVGPIPALVPGKWGGSRAQIPDSASHSRGWERCPAGSCGSLQALCPLGSWMAPSWESGEGEGSGFCIAGAVGVLQKGSSEGCSDSRMEQGAGMEQLGTCQPHQSEGTEHPQCCPLCQLGPCSTQRSQGSVPSQECWQRALGWARGRPCPFLHASGRVPQLKRLPKITHPEVAVAGHPQGSQLLGHSVSSRCPSGFSLYFVCLVIPVAGVLLAVYPREGLFPRLSVISSCRRAAFLSSWCAKAPTEELRTSQRCFNEDIAVPIGQ